MQMHTMPHRRRGARSGVRLALFAAMALLLSTTPAPRAQARAPLQTIMQDDAALLYGAPGPALLQMRALGVDRVRLTASWRRLAPAPDSFAPPQAFDATNPTAYPSTQALSGLDTAVVQASALGLHPMIDLAFGAPDWASHPDAGDRGRGITYPDAAAYGRFAAAIARRYDGTLTPPGAIAPLPRVDTFTIWNEPNHPGFLRPQWVDGQPASPAIYRRLLLAAYPAIKRVQPDSTVLIGATSANGSDTGDRAAPVPPLRFIRELACVDRQLHPLDTAGCRGFARLPGDGFSHHPYALASASGRLGGDDVGIGDLPRLTGLLDRLAAAGRISSADRDVWITEFGYEPDVPLFTKPWTLGQQRLLLARAEYTAWSDPQVRTFAQFQLRDVATLPGLARALFGPPGRANGSWQTGLFFGNGWPKPAAAGFRLTLVPLRLGPSTLLWGHVRPARDGAVAAVMLQRRTPGGSWTLVRSRPAGTGANAGRGQAPDVFATAPGGFFERSVAGAAGARYRLLWLDPATGAWEPSPGT